LSICRCVVEEQTVCLQPISATLRREEECLSEVLRRATAISYPAQARSDPRKHARRTLKTAEKRPFSQSTSVTPGEITLICFFLAPAGVRCTGYGGADCLALTVVVHEPPALAVMRHTLSLIPLLVFGPRCRVWRGSTGATGRSQDVGPIWQYRSLRGKSCAV
jgi:hypothetical protein